MKKADFMRKLFETTSSKLLKYIMCVCRDRHLAEDILQETYFEALLHKAVLMKHENVNGWLYRTASYKILNAFRKRETQNVSIHELLGENQEPGNYEVGYVACESRLILESVLNKNERNLVLLHYIHGYTWKEISETEGVSEGALKTQMFRIKKKLKEKLGKDIKL